MVENFESRGPSAESLVYPVPQSGNLHQVPYRICNMFYIYNTTRSNLLIKFWFRVTSAVICRYDDDVDGIDDDDDDDDDDDESIKMSRYCS